MEPCYDCYFALFRAKPRQRAGRLLLPHVHTRNLEHLSVDSCLARNNNLAPYRGETSANRSDIVCSSPKLTVMSIRLALMGGGRSAIFHRAHILKFGLLVFSPNALWIQACILSNPTKSTSMTFGQVSNITTFELLFEDVSFRFFKSNAIDLCFHCFPCYAFISGRQTPTC
jgi:hypothetical protein